MAFLHKEDDHNTTDERKQYGAEDRYSSEPQKAHLTGEFIIVGNGGHVLRHLASRLANVVREGGREADSRGPPQFGIMSRTSGITGINQGIIGI